MDEQQRQRCFTISKGITYFAYALYALFALLFIALGGAAVKGLNKYSEAYKASIPAGLIVLGVFQLIIVILGFVGTLKRKQGLVIAYLVLMCILIVCEWGVGGGAYALKGDISEKLTTNWETANAADKENLQSDFACCGWSDYSQGNFTGSSCQNVTAATQPSIPLCQQVIVDGFSKYLTQTGAIGITFATLQLVGVVTTGIVLGCIQQEERYKKFSTMS